MADADLVGLTLAGRDEAFEALVVRYMPVIIGHLYGKTGESEAEDLAQEVLIKAYRNLRQLREPRLFGPWLMRIMRSRLMDHYRASARRPQTVTSFENADGEPTDPLSLAREDGPSPHEHACMAEVRQIVFREIATLDEKYQSVLLLRVLGEAGSEEIARRLGLPLTTVRMRLFRGMQMLRKALRRLGIGPEVLG